MKLTTKGRYAVTAMLDITLNQGSGAVSLSDISQRQSISQSYLEQLFTKLRKRRLVDSVRGPGGGYQLARAAEAITIADIIAAINEPMDATKCGGAKNCQGGKKCLTHHLWAELNDVIVDFLKQVTLASLVAQHHEQAEIILQAFTEVEEK